MSEAVSPLNGAAFDGIARVAEQGPRGMLTLRGDLSDQAFTGAVATAAGVDVPGPRGCALSDDGRGLAWMSPDELLLMLPYDAAAQTATDLRAAFNGQHAMVANVSDARAVFAIEGPRAREVLAKLAPVDLSPAAFAPGEIRRTRVAQVAAAFWMTGPDRFELVCFRSVAHYVHDLLTGAAAPGGEVDYF